MTSAVFELDLVSLFGNRIFGCMEPPYHQHHCTVPLFHRFLISFEARVSFVRSFLHAVCLWRSAVPSGATGGRRTDSAPGAPWSVEDGRGNQRTTERVGVLDRSPEAEPTISCRRLFSFYTPRRLNLEIGRFHFPSKSRLCT